MAEAARFERAHDFHRGYCLAGRHHTGFGHASNREIKMVRPLRFELRCPKTIGFEPIASAVPPWAHMEKTIRITFKNNTTIETDAIFSIDFEVDRIVIRGWKNGLNQTLDEFRFAEIRRIEFPRE